jgi:survival motor neuron protein
MTNSSNVVKTTNPSNDDFFLCRAFAKAISSDKLLQIIEQQPISTESLIENVPSNENVEMIENSSLFSENNQWKVGDLCLCPYNEDNLLYKATIIHIDSSSCTVSFDDYGNEEIHPLIDLQLRTEEEQQQPVTSINEDDILPPHPPFPVLNTNDDNDTLSSTLMSWYLAGYHTGFYQGIKDKK